LNQFPYQNITEPSPTYFNNYEKLLQ